MSSPRITTLNLPPPFAAAAPASADRRLRGLVEQHFEFIGRVVRNLGVAEAEIDDVLQQVFCAAASRLPDLLEGSERAFLVQAAVNWAANTRRARFRRREVAVAELPEIVDEAPTPEDATDRKRAAAILDALLATMDLDLRTVFVLYEIERLSRSEIAALLELAEGTVASRLRRARDDFQLRLERWRRSDRMPGGAP
jgi:RNA polymerase sigma-70 factor (ECF subfamily)